MLWLLPLGLALGHAVGSWLGGQAGAGSVSSWPGVFAPLAVVGGPLAAVALARMFLAGRDRQSVAISPGRLVVTQVLAFAAIESVEHLATGVSMGHLFGHAACWWGLLGQVLVALALFGLARLTVATGRAWGDRTVPTWGRAANRPAPIEPAGLSANWLLASLPLRRGPPLRGLFS